MLFYFFKFFLFSENFSFYINYLISLNSWSTNLFFLFLMFYFLFNIKMSYLLVFVSYFLAESSFINWNYLKSVLSTLILGTITIHPLLFYISLVYFLSIFFKNFFFYKLKFSMLFYLSCTVITFLLGGLWGLQSVTWGYFWSNDGIEWALVFIIFYYVFLLHKRLSTPTIINIFSTLLILFNFIILIRLNLVTTRHSFFVKKELNYTIWKCYFLYFFALLYYPSIPKLFFLISHVTYIYTLITIFFVQFNSNIYVLKFCFFLYALVICNNYFIFFSIKIYLFHFCLLLLSIVWSQFFFLITLIFGFVKHWSLAHLTIFFNTVDSEFLIESTFTGSSYLEQVTFYFSFIENFLISSRSYHNYFLLFLNNFSFISFSLFVLFFLLSKGLNLDYYIKRKHIFKNRKKFIISSVSQISNKYQYIYSVKKFRLEFVYIRLFKKLLRRKFVKAKMRFFKAKYWLYLMPNYILTQKSKNARMGAGVGNFVRLANIILPQKSLIKTWHYTIRYLNAMTKYLRYKIPNKFLIKNVTNQETNDKYTF